MIFPDCKMSRIILHWTAGNNSPSKDDLAHYHFVIDGNGRILQGVNINLNARPLSKNYAAHTAGANTGAIGISLAGMRDAVERPFSAGDQPINKKQVDAAIQLCADLAKFYRIPVRRDTILSHAEVQDTLGIKQKGKWDIAIFPFATQYNTAQKCGDYFRTHIHDRISNG